MAELKIGLSTMVLTGGRYSGFPLSTSVFKSVDFSIRVGRIFSSFAIVCNLFPNLSLAVEHM